MSKKKNVIARSGNFEVTKDSGPEHDYIRIKAINGNWGLSYRDDNEMYGKILAMCKDPEYAEGLRMWIVMNYTMSNMIYDEGFLRDWWDAIGKLSDRRVAAAPVPTDKENEDAMAETQIMEESKEMLNDDQGGD